MVQGYLQRMFYRTCSHSSVLDSFDMENGSRRWTRAAAGVVLALFLALFVMAWHLGSDPPVHGSTSHPLWDREVNGLEFIRKSLETTWLAGSQDQGSIVSSHKQPHISVWHSSIDRSSKCKMHEIDGCHSRCNPEVGKKQVIQIVEASERKISVRAYVRVCICAYVFVRARVRTCASSCAHACALDQ